MEDLPQHGDSREVISRGVPVALGVLRCRYQANALTDSFAGEFVPRTSLTPG